MFPRGACGVGLICNLRGEKSHDIVQKGLDILTNLAHRGATGADEKTGDGAGILLQIPHSFYKDQASSLGWRIPDEKEYGTGLVFMPTDDLQRREATALVEQIVKSYGQTVIGWRELPVHSENIGAIAHATEPYMMQLFVGRGPGIADDRAFEQKLYIIRKVIENAVRKTNWPQKKFFYIPSLSCNTITYKGLLLAEQIRPYFQDLTDPALVSGLALVHQRYSTNTFPTWDLAQPFRFLSHNGEINTLRGNINWMNARQGLFKSPNFGEDMIKICPVLTEGASDSAILDNAVELLYHAGRSLPHVISMLIPEAWQNHQTMSEQKKAFYEYHSCLMEPWDGPASITFSDGVCVGAVLDRNGLRPSRYTVTKDGLVIMGSETGVIDVAPENILLRGRLQPGKMFLVNTAEGRIIDDDEIKSELGARASYRSWLNKKMVNINDLTAPDALSQIKQDMSPQFRLFGYTEEDFKLIIGPMTDQGAEPTGSMGTDTPLAVLSLKARLLYDYFHQLFAQVTNPPLDSIREELVTSLITNIGSEKDLFEETPEHCRFLKLEHPILSNTDLKKIKDLNLEGLRTTTISILYNVHEGGKGMETALEDIFNQASKAVEDGYNIIVLSDRYANQDNAPIPALLAAAGIHHHLIRNMQRTRCGLILESGEPREVHHICTLFGYGINAINPYLAFAAIDHLIEKKLIPVKEKEHGYKNYIKAINKGVLKTMSKMGISTLQSYRGAQIFEAVGLGSNLINKYFPGTTSRIEGIGLDEIAREVSMRYTDAFPKRPAASTPYVPSGGQYKWRRDGEAHILEPIVIAKLQQAVRKNNHAVYNEFALLVNNRTPCTLRGLFDFKPAGPPIPIAEVESWADIVKRFKTGAMSYGSISQEAHETIAIAMNHLGGKSNSGEGGEDQYRYRPTTTGLWKRSAIKQIASGRFGVTSNYLANAKELQIKMAQGAKPGEGGQLPGFKVYPWIAKTRHSTPYVTLISPPPHHDIYSIEDLAQLINDLKMANPSARINVKLVAEIGVGTVSVGVVKGKADVILVSGYDGGTGASPISSIKHAGLPWELGLAEVQQSLVINNLRERVRLECDGKLLTGRDVAVACLLGAEEFGFSTGPLISLGCVMMRVCHLNTCPVGIATQDPELRKKFAGRPEHIINYMRFVAEELRDIMARLGFRTLDEMIGRSDCLVRRENIDHWKANKLNLASIINQRLPARHYGWEKERSPCTTTDDEIITLCRPALEQRRKVELTVPIRNVNRTFGTKLSYWISHNFGEDGLSEDTIQINCLGSAGQSFAAFGARGLTLYIEGDANDYFGKGLSGAKLIIRPSSRATYIPEENIIIGNVAFYGATDGEAYIRGLAGERFGVRNSGVTAVVEGVGDHGCEYMTGGRVVVLGPTGRNFAAGMSGGIAYVLDENGDFEKYQCNQEMVVLERMTEPKDIEELYEMVSRHHQYTDSTVAKRILDSWEETLGSFVKVMPIDYRRAMDIMAHQDLETEIEPVYLNPELKIRNLESEQS